MAPRGDASSCHYRHSATSPGPLTPQAHQTLSSLSLSIPACFTAMTIRIAHVRQPKPSESERPRITLGGRGGSSRGRRRPTQCIPAPRTRPPPCPRTPSPPPRHMPPPPALALRSQRRVRRARVAGPVWRARPGPVWRREPVQHPAGYVQRPPVHQQHAYARLSGSSGTTTTAFSSSSSTTTTASCSSSTFTTTARALASQVCDPPLLRADVTRLDSLGDSSPS